MRRFIILVVAGVSALLIVSGCTASSKNASGGSGGGGGAASAPAAGAASPQAANRKAAGDSAFATTLLTRALVKTADLTVRVADVDKQAARAIDIATSSSVDADQRSGSGTGASAQSTLEVPPNSLEDVLNRLAAGGKPTVRKTSTQDVTEQVADVNARLASMRASLARVRALYARAATIDDVIKIKKPLATREAGLESMEAQQLSLSKQTAMAVVHLQLLAKQAAAPAAPERPRSALGGFAIGWTAFTQSARWTLTAFGAVLPFLVVLSGLAFGALWLRRRHTTTAQSRPVEGAVARPWARDAALGSSSTSSGEFE